jgi:hypothetical protein
MKLKKKIFFEMSRPENETRLKKEKKTKYFVIKFEFFFVGFFK